MAKAQRTSRELQEAIMHEVRRHPEWSDILSVTITKRSQAAPHHPNWDAPSQALRQPAAARRGGTRESEPAKCCATLVTFDPSAQG